MLDASEASPFLQIVPPGRGGVRDHATALAEVLCARGIIAPVLPLQRSGGAALLDAALTNRKQVILHFSGYGYAPRGLCFWLVRLLRELKRAGRITRLIVFFHEVSAFGPPWASAFYTAFLQKQVASSLCRLADELLTNCARHADMLKIIAGERATTIPVFSNVGELPSTERQTTERQNVVIAFGTFRSRNGSVALAARMPAGRPPLREYGIGGASMLTAHGGTYCGEKDKAALSSILSQATYGLVSHGPSEAAKSGVFAAYAAHGCIPILGKRLGGERDGLQYGVHYILPEDIAFTSDTDAARIRFSLSGWYDGHALANQALTLGDILHVGT